MRKKAKIFFVHGISGCNNWCEAPASNLPFELLYHTDFLVPSRIHLIRHVSDRGIKTTPEQMDHPLKILFMACSPLYTYPVLEFEKEEDTIFEVTKNDGSPLHVPLVAKGQKKQPTPRELQ